MRIKKTKNGNEYVYAGGVWIRNFTKQCQTPLLLNTLVEKKDQELVLENQLLNARKQTGFISEEDFIAKKVVIISDGFDFVKRQHILSQLPEDVAIFAVNNVINKWDLLQGEHSKNINLYIVNNPYDECVRYLPSKKKPYYPACVASTRTCCNFVSKYQGRLYCYEPTPEIQFGHKRISSKTVDDYRNPICAGIDLAFQFGVEKLMLFCCDDSFENQRDYSVKLKNGFYTYPQHLKCHEIIDAKMFWLKHFSDRKIEISDYSSGPKYNNTIYIRSDKQMIEFFSNEKSEEVNSDA